VSKALAIFISNEVMSMINMDEKQFFGTVVTRQYCVESYFE
jgi:hypothetical protein